MTGTEDAPLRLAAVDDHPFVLNGILWTVHEYAPWVQVIGTAASVAELLASGAAPPTSCCWTWISGSRPTRPTRPATCGPSGRPGRRC